MKKLISSLLLIAAPMASACPTVEDMTAKGVYVQLQTARGDIHQRVYRKVKGGIEQTDSTSWLVSSHTTQTLYHSGLFPLNYKTLKVQKGSALKPKKYTYRGGLSRIQIKPKSQFTLQATELASDGFIRETITTYNTKRIKTSRIAGCSLRTMKIIAHEDWTGSKTTYELLYFVDLGFAVGLKDIFPGKTFERKIVKIAGG